VHMNVQSITTDHSVSALGSSTATSMGISGICMVAVAGVGGLKYAQKTGICDEVLKAAINEV
jgi:hypothetical protein